MKTTITFLALLTMTLSLQAQTLSKRQLKKMNNAASSIFKGQCPLERVDWMEVSDGYDRNTIIALATELEASAKADAAKIKDIAEGKLSGNVKGDFKNSIEKMSQKKVKVSQEFYEQYLMMRAPVCQIYQSVQSGFYNNNPAALMKAQDEFIEMNKSWLKYVQEEQKKKPTLIIEAVRDSLVYFTINNNNPDRDLKISRIYLRHNIKKDQQKGAGWTIEWQPRENLGKYVIDRNTDNIYLTPDLSTLSIKKSTSVSFSFAIDLVQENKYLEWSSNSTLIVEYIGRTDLNILKSDLKYRRLVYEE